MPLLPFAWPVSVPFWLTCAWAFAPEWRYFRQDLGSAASRGAEDAGSMRVAIGCNALATASAFCLAFVAQSAAMTAPVTAYVAGIALLIAGGLLRRHCFRMLGSRFTYAVQVHADQEIVERGAYRWVRHPSYTAGILFLAGIGVGLGNWASLAASLAITTLGYLYRVAVEERALVATLGAVYEDYMKRTRRFIPFVL